jgi:hypothetical protein
MKTSLTCLALMLTIVCRAQQAPEAPTPKLKSRTGEPVDESKPVSKALVWTLPAGTKIPVQLRQPISTKNAQPGDGIYAQTTFPVLIGQQVLIPAGTFAQGVVDSVKRAGRIKGRAELQFHLTTLIYPNGYSVDLVAPVAQVPGSESTTMKEPGVVRHDPEKGKDLERIGTDASLGAGIGTVVGVAARPTLGGVRAGGLAGLAGGTLIALLARGSDVRFEVGTVVDVVLDQAVTLDGASVMKPASLPAYYPGYPGQPYPPTQ